MYAPSPPQSNTEKQVSTALLLAAGTGSRLYPLTRNAPKCLTMVNDVCILERLVQSLIAHNFERLVVVTGHLENHIRKFLDEQSCNLTIEYVYNPLYKTTNNIYSLWLARELMNEPFLLIESDLVFDSSLLKGMLYPDRIAVSRMRPWLNGSTVTLNQFNKVTSFQNNKTMPSNQIKYKTVNIYSLSLLSWHKMIEKLNQSILAGHVTDYYEIIFSQMVIEKTLSLDAVFFDHKPWYEIDTLEDLDSAEILFSLKTYGSLSVSRYQTPAADKTYRPA